MSEPARLLQLTKADKLRKKQQEKRMSRQAFFTNPIAFTSSLLGNLEVADYNACRRMLKNQYKMHTPIPRETHHLGRAQCISVSLSQHQPLKKERHQVFRSSSFCQQSKSRLSPRSFRVDISGIPGLQKLP